MIKAMGLMGAAIATAVAWGLRLAGGYAILARNRSHLSAPAEESRGEETSIGE